MFERCAPLLLLAAAALAGCTNQAPFATTFGSLAPGSTLTVRIADGTFNAYHPEQGQPGDRFTVSATAKRSSNPAAPRLRAVGNGVIVTATDPLAGLLVRVPKDVNLVVESSRGAVRVTDITGNATMSAGDGDINAMLPGYAQAHTAHGNISVRVGAGDWPGTLRFTSGRGTIEVWIRDSAAFHVHLHTENGTIFTDFNLRGTAQGTAETIDGAVAGGGNHGIDIETANGDIRLLQLHPQA